MDNKVYICGKITGLEPNVVWDKFFKAEELMKSFGLEVVNPLRVHGINSLEDYYAHEKREWHMYLREDIAELVKCGRLYAMKCWVHSDGAKLELHIAESLGIKITYCQ